MSKPRNATTRGSKRFYTWGDERFWSVTTIVNGGLAKPVLVNWAKKFTAEYAVDHFDALTKLVADDRDGAVDWLKGAAFRDRDKKGNLGSAVHDATEAYVLGRPMPPWPDEIRPHMLHFEHFLSEWEPTYELTESSVYSRSQRYAGTLDAIVMLGDRRILLDTKTGAKGPYPEVALQVAAYRYAEFIGMPDGTEAPMPEVDGCAVLKLTDEGFELYDVLADETIHNCFLYVRECFRFIEEIAPTVLAPYNDMALAAAKAGA